MNEARKHLINRVKAYLATKEKDTVKVTSTIRGVLEMRTEQIDVLLEALCLYQSLNEDKMASRDELIHKFFCG